MLELIHFNILSVLLFSVGLYGVLARKSAILIIMAIELMLNLSLIHISEPTRPY